MRPDRRGHRVVWIIPAPTRTNATIARETGGLRSRREPGNSAKRCSTLLGLAEFAGAGAGAVRGAGVDDGAGAGAPASADGRAGADGRAPVHDVAVAAAMARALADRTVEQWVIALTASGVPACQVLERVEFDDPFLCDQNYTKVVHTTTVGRLRLIGGFTDWHGVRRRDATNHETTGVAHKER